jgi:large subunit ribosomal protein L3
VTVIDASSCTVVGKRTPEKDRYSAVTLGFGEVKEKRLSKAELGTFKKAGTPPKRHLKEFRITPEEANAFTVGEPVKVDLFSKGELVDVTGITKGRGFQGVMKRWNFRGYGQTHGTHEYRRHPGAIGQRKTPGRVYPNKKMPGHYGVVLQPRGAATKPMQRRAYVRGLLGSVHPSSAGACASALTSA